MTTPLHQATKVPPVLDEAGFEQLLQAAFVLQQHNDTLRAKNPRLDTAWAFSRIAETQSMLRAGRLDFTSAARLIAERLQTMTDSAGVSISLVAEGYLFGIAESGAAAKVPGSSLASHSLVATERLKTGRVFQSADAQRDIRLDIPACQQLGVLALLAVPVHRSGQIAGLIEVRWSKPDAFHECDVRTCQMMAALVSEMLEENRGPGNMVPNHAPPVSAAVDEDPAPEEANPNAPSPAAEQSADLDLPRSFTSPKPSSDGLASQCRVCGRTFIGDEAFCGNCSMPRVAGGSADGLQSKWASLWYMQQAQAGPEEFEASPEPESERRNLLHDASTPPRDPGAPIQPESLWRRPEKTAELMWGDPSSADELPLLPETFAPPSWDDAIGSAWRNFVARLRGSGRRGATVGLALLAVLLLAVAWGSRPSPGWPGVTRFEAVLVKLGLAEVPQRAPAPPRGNPSLRVWVDVHTALYYCPGSELYGNTPDGQFETQLDAQTDQFKSATGAVCSKNSRPLGLRD